MKRSPLCTQMLEMCEFYMFFEIDDRTGQPLSDSDMEQSHYHRVQVVQGIAFKYFQDKLLSLALSPVRSIDNPDLLREYITALDDVDLRQFLVRLELVDENEGDLARELLEQILVTFASKKPSRLQAVRKLPLYPTEALMFDESVMPSSTMPLTVYVPTAYTLSRRLQRRPLLGASQAEHAVSVNQRLPASKLSSISS